MQELRRTKVACFDESTLVTLQDLIDAFHYYKNENNDKGNGVDGVSHVIQATTYNWKDEILQSQKPLVVEFYSPTCPHCRRLTPIFERLSNEYADRLKFVMVDTSVESDLASGYGIMGVPTLKFICSGRPVGAGA